MFTVYYSSPVLGTSPCITIQCEISLRYHPKPEGSCATTGVGRSSPTYLPKVPSGWRGLSKSCMKSSSLSIPDVGAVFHIKGSMRAYQNAYEFGPHLCDSHLLCLVRESRPQSVWAVCTLGRSFACLHNVKYLKICVALSGTLLQKKCHGMLA